MNKFSAWFIATIIVMIGFPWLAVTFAGIYLLIGIVAMFISAFYIKNSKFKCF